MPYGAPYFRTLPVDDYPSNAPSRRRLPHRDQRDTRQQCRKDVLQDTNQALFQGRNYEN